METPHGDSAIYLEEDEVIDDMKEAKEMEQSSEKELIEYGAARHQDEGHEVIHELQQVVLATP